MNEQKPEQGKQEVRKDSGGSNPERGRADDREPTPRFDDGERKPAPIERTGDDGVRSRVVNEPASSEGQHSADTDKHTEATMPPGEGQNPKRNTM
jgi:hypothetical protein